MKEAARDLWNKSSSQSKAQASIRVLQLAPCPPRSLPPLPRSLPIASRATRHTHSPRRPNADTHSSQ